MSVALLDLICGTALKSLMMTKKKGFSGTQSDSLFIKLGGNEEKGGAVRC